jgi:hypothetical protein
MGYASYSVSDRTTKARSAGYFTKSSNEIFTQSVERKIHEQMNPSGVVIRESRDSDTHPNTIPIQLYLDVTGSMGRIPHELIKDGLPTLMGSLTQNGVPDAALMFGAIGDHECDKFPLQIAQFESGDDELDMWLTRTYLEGGGGGNEGESYLLAWYFAANHVKTDAFDKRNKKGFVFTIGDEPCLKSLPINAVKGVMNESAIGQKTYTREDLLETAQKQNHVFHIHVNHGGRSLDRGWKELLGDNLIETSDPKSIAKIISEAILSKLDMPISLVKKDDASKDETKDQEIFL